MEIKQEILNTLIEFNGFIKELKSSKISLYNELSRLDGRRNDLLHYIEGIDTFDDVRVHPMKIYKELSIVSKERRVVKNNIAIMASAVANFNLKNISKTITNIEGLPKKYGMRHYSKNFKELLDNREGDNNGKTQE